MIHSTQLWLELRMKKNFNRKVLMDRRVFRMALAERGLNQIQLAIALRISPSTLTYYLQGYYQPPNKIQEKIAAYLNLQREELFPDRIGVPVNSGSSHKTS